MEVFQKIYPFATENVKDSFKLLDLEGKKVFTVGSSLDQVFDAVLYGASEIILYDINKCKKEFYNFKKQILMNKRRVEFYDNVLQQCDSVNYFCFQDISSKESVYRGCKYLENDEQYRILREKIDNTKLQFVDGDIFQMNQILGNQRYDRIIFSNILQYLEYFKPENIGTYAFLKDQFEKWCQHLNDGAILELCYLYSIFEKGQLLQNHSLAIYDLRKIWETLNVKGLFIEKVPSFIGDSNYQDGILTYRN